MKKLYLVIALLVAIPISLISKVDIGFQPQAHTQNSGAVKMDRNLNISEYSKDKNSFPSSLSSFNKLDSTIDLYWNAYFNDVTPISYEPISGVLFMVQSNRYNRISGSDTLFHGDIYLYYSTDKGKSWSKETIFSKDGDIAVMPSVTVSNPTKSKNPNDLFVVVFTRLFRQDPLSPDNYPLFGGLYIISDGVGLTDNNFFEYEEPGPAQNNPGYYWGLSKGVSYSGNGNSFSYFYGTLYDRNIYQYGLYGISNMAFKSGDGLISNNSFMPAPWGLTTWRASDAIGSSYNAPMLVDVDEEGTLYAVFNNIFADNTERRAVAVAKSTDNGETWSEFDRFPQSVWDAYNTKYNLQSSFCPSLLPYGSNAFVVTGVNEFSFIMPFYKAPLDTNIQDPEGVFVEVYKVKGEWKM